MHKRFCRTLLQIEILTNAGVGIPEDLDEVDALIMEGNAFSEVSLVMSEGVDASTMACLLEKQRSGSETLLGDALNRCPECNDQGEERPCAERDYVEYKCPSCEHVWELPKVVFGNYVPTRRVEFICIGEDQGWELIIRDVPVEVRWDGLQAWADENLGRQCQFRKCLRIMPWNHSPEEECDA